MLNINEVEHAQYCIINVLQDLDMRGCDKVAAIECLFQQVVEAKGKKPIRRTVADALERAQTINETFKDLRATKAVALFVKNELDI